MEYHAQLTSPETVSCPQCGFEFDMPPPRPLEMLGRTVMTHVVVAKRGAKIGDSAPGVTVEPGPHVRDSVIGDAPSLTGGHKKYVVVAGGVAKISADRVDIHD